MVGYAMVVASFVVVEFVAASLIAVVGTVASLVAVEMASWIVAVVSFRPMASCAVPV